MDSVLHTLIAKAYSLSQDQVALNIRQTINQGCVKLMSIWMTKTFKHYFLLLVQLAGVKRNKNNSYSVIWYEEKYF